MGSGLTDSLAGTGEGARLLQQERTILEITELVCKIMEEEGVSKVELARALGTSKANVTQMLDGQRNLTVRTLSDVLYALGRKLVAGTEGLAELSQSQPPGIWSLSSLTSRWGQAGRPWKRAVPGGVCGVRDGSDHPDTRLRMAG